MRHGVMNNAASADESFAIAAKIWLLIFYLFPNEPNDAWQCAYQSEASGVEFVNLMKDVVDLVEHKTFA